MSISPKVDFIDEENKNGETPAMIHGVRVIVEANKLNDGNSNFQFVSV